MRPTSIGTRPRSVQRAWDFWCFEMRSSRHAVGRSVTMVALALIGAGLGVFSTLLITNNASPIESAEIGISTCGIEAVALRLSTFVESYNAGLAPAAASHISERARLDWLGEADADQEDSQSRTLESLIRVQHRLGDRIRDQVILDVGSRSAGGGVMFTGEARRNQNDVLVSGRYNCLDGRFTALELVDAASQPDRIALQQG